MRNPRLLIALVIGTCGLALVVASCDRERAATPGPAASAPNDAPGFRREGHLKLLALPGYAERGGSDASVDWIGGFEQRSQCRVEIETVPDEAALLARMAGDGIDAAIVPGELALTLVASGDVRPIEPDRVPLLAGVAPHVRDAAAVRHGGKRFDVPFVWRPLVLRYRRATFAQAPTTQALYVPQTLRGGGSTAGRVQAFDGPLAIAAAALHLGKLQPELGIDDPFALNATQYEGALGLLRAQRTLVHRYWVDRAEQDADFLHADLVLANGWAGSDRRWAAVDPANVAASVTWVVPEEGVIARADGSMLHARAKHPNCAYAWFDWTLEPRVQAQAAYWLGAVPAVPTACGAHARLGEGGCIANGSGLLPVARFARAAQAHCGRSGDCVPYSRWTEDFHAIRGQ